MTHFALFLNRSITDEFSPVFEIIYASEVVFLVVFVFSVPLTAWITLNAAPLHPNLRYILVCVMFHGWIGGISRIVIIAGQRFMEENIEWKIIITMASFTRRHFFHFFVICSFGVTAERFVATFYWKWYERQGRRTIFVFWIILAILEIISSRMAYVRTFGNVMDDTTHASTVFIFLATLLFLGGIVFLGLSFYNMHEVAKLSRRGANRYSLARSYQLRENVAVIMILLRFIAFMILMCIPAMIFRALFINLASKFQFLRLLSIALFDWWTSAAILIESLAFPLIDIRFRRVAIRFRLYRWMPSRFIAYFTDIAKEDQKAHAEQYFMWLNRDLK